MASVLGEDVIEVKNIRHHKFSFEVIDLPRYVVIDGDNITINHLMPHFLMSSLNKLKFITKNLLLCSLVLPLISNALPIYLAFLCTSPYIPIVGIV